MLFVKNKSKIFVACPYTSTSGGAETLHQLVDQLNNIGYEAYIYYFDKSKVSEINDKFKKYNINYTTKVEDKLDDILIISESFTELLYKYRKIRKVIWWLSVDFYFSSFIDKQFEMMMKDRNLPKKFSSVFKVLYYSYTICITKKFRKFKFQKDKNEYIHLYNCEYAKQFLKKKGISNDNMFYLCGPIRKEFFESTDISQKENIVVYNPAKGLEYAKKIRNKMKDKDEKIKFIPIINMKPCEIINLLRRAKVYIDFGFFPGPERIPREAVSCKCNLITSNIGSAKNKIDVPIPKEFKFDIDDKNINDICNLINDMVYDFDYYTSLFDIYREKVKKQNDIFKKNISLIFRKCNEV